MFPDLTPHARHLLRDLAPQVLSAVYRRTGDFEASEDALQEALIAAASQWPSEGMPDNPKSWLIRVASRRLVDQVRSEAARRRRESMVVSLIPPEEQATAIDREAPERDDTLELFFMCCHPRLSNNAAITLTLRAVGGLTTAEIAKAFMLPEATIAQRISRAKQRLKADGTQLSIPGDEDLTPRLQAVLHVLYLIFSEGYTASFGTDLLRQDLAAEAMRLTRMLHRLMPDHGEVTGLLALMLLTEARRLARTGPNGELIPLDRQDRSLWTRETIEEGVALVTQTLSGGSIGPYQLQAAIAAVHDEAPSTEATDWAEILGLYTLLWRMTGNPMVALNRAVAVAMVHGNESGLAQLDALAKDPRIADHYRLDAVRGHLWERAGDLTKAKRHYLRAAKRTASMPERDYLISQTASLD